MFQTLPRASALKGFVFKTLSSPCVFYCYLWDHYFRHVNGSHDIYWRFVHYNWNPSATSLFLSLYAPRTTGPRHSQLWRRTCRVENMVPLSPFKSTQCFCLHLQIMIVFLLHIIKDSTADRQKFIHMRMLLASLMNVKKTQDQKKTSCVRQPKSKCSLDADFIVSYSEQRLLWVWVAHRSRQLIDILLRYVMKTKQIYVYYIFYFLSNVISM